MILSWHENVVSFYGHRIGLYFVIDVGGDDGDDDDDDDDNDDGDGSGGCGDETILF